MQPTTSSSTALPTLAIAPSLTRLASRAIKNNSSLQPLSLSDQHLTSDEIVGEVTQYPRLKALDLSGTQITDRGIQAIVKSCPSLREVFLGKTLITDGGVLPLATCFEIQAVDLTGRRAKKMQVTSVGIKALVAFPHLKALYLAYNSFGDAGLQLLGKALAKHRTLKILDLTGNSIGDKGAKILGLALTTNRVLTSLTLSDNGISTDGAGQLSRGLVNNSSLKLLDLSSNKIGAEGVERLAVALSQNRSLHTLSLACTDIHDEGVKPLHIVLAKNRSLTRLNLSTNDMGPASARLLGKVLASSSTLTSLNLNSNRLGDEGATAISESLSKNSTLQVLELASNDIQDAGVEVLHLLLTKNSSLTHLDLSTNPIGPPAARLLSRALISNRTLTSLNLNFNRLEDEGATAISEGLSKNSTLQILKLGSNHIHDPGASALAESLKSNPSLTTLHLQANTIKIPGIRALGEVLHQNSILTELSLRSNKIDGTGLRLLSDTLRQNSSLKVLDLSLNAIQLAGLSTFATALASHRGLVSLHLRHNQIDESGAQALAKAFPKNSSLTRLDLTRNPVPTESPTLKSIEQALVRNKAKRSSLAQRAPGLPLYVTELYTRLERCFAQKEPDPFGPIFAGFNALVPGCTRAEKAVLAKLLPRLHPFTSLFTDAERTQLISADFVGAQHSALASYRTLEQELIQTRRATTNPAFRQQILTLEGHYKEELRKLLRAQDRRAFLKPKAQLFYEGHFLIPRTHAFRLLSCDQTGTITRKNKTGSRPVTMSHGIHFKVGAQGFPALDPAGEHAVSSLCHLLSPNAMIAAPTAILSIRTPTAKAHVQASLTVGDQCESLSIIESFQLLQRYYSSGPLFNQSRRFLRWAFPEKSSTLVQHLDPAPNSLDDHFIIQSFFWAQHYVRSSPFLQTQWQRFLTWSSGGGSSTVGHHPAPISLGKSLRITERFDLFRRYLSASPLLKQSQRFLTWAGLEESSTTGHHPTAIPLDELLSTIESFHLLQSYFGSNAHLKAQWERLLSWAQHSDVPAEPEAVFNDYLRWMQVHPSRNRAKEFQDGAPSLKIGDFRDYLPHYPLPLWTKLLKLLRQEPGLMKGQSIKALLRLTPSLIWISKLFPNMSFNQIAQQLPILLDKVDRDALSRLLVASLMVSPHDGKADNYMCAIDWKTDSIERLRIIAIDNDLAFEPPILKSRNHHHTRTKCLLYALPPKLLKSTIPAKVREDICSEEALDLILEWVIGLDQYQSQSEMPFFLKLPKQALATAFHRLSKIQLLLNQKMTLEELLRRVEPVVFHSYREALRQEGGIREAFALLDWKAGRPLDKLLEKTFVRIDYKGETLSLQEAYRRDAQRETPRTTLAAATQALLDDASLSLDQRHYHPITNLSFVEKLKVKLRSPQKLLLSSIRAGHLPFTRLALLNGADPNKCDDNDHPPLYHLIPLPTKGEETLKCLVASGANLEWRDPKNDQTLLDLTASRALLDEFIALVHAGAGRDCQAAQVLAFAQAFIDQPGMGEALQQLERQRHRIGWLQDLPAMLIDQPTAGSLPLQRALLKETKEIELPKTYLHPAVVRQIGITSNRRFPDKPRHQFGRHMVASVEHQGRKLTFKDRPEMAGNEFLVSSLHRKMIGHGTPYSELFKARDAFGKVYPVQASQTIEGANFHDVFYGPDSAEKLALLDQHRLHNLILLALLTRPEDGKSEQYIYSPLAEGRYQLTCVDNDHAFVRPFEGKKLMVKCILFCLDQMQEPINPNTRKLFLNIDPEVFLRRWLRDCATQNKLYTALFDDPERQAQIRSNQREPLIIQMFLPARTTAKMFEALTRIQEALKNEAMTPLSLLLYAIPTLGRYYEQLFAPQYRSPQERWQQVKKAGGYLNDVSGGERTCTSTLDLLKHFHIHPRALLKCNPAYFIKQGQAELVRLKAEQQRITAITRDLLQGKTEGFKRLLLDHSREKALKGYPFGERPSRDQKVFQAIHSIQASFFHLNLSNKRPYSFRRAWRSFNLALPFSPFLRSLNLDRCNDVSSEFVWGLSKLCPHLKHLSLVACSSLTDLWANIQWLTFPDLQSLNLQRSNLRRFHIRAKRLTTFDISDSTQLERLLLDLPILQRAKLDGCIKLSIDELKKVARKLKSGRITATRCPVLKPLNHRSLIERCLPLIFSPLNRFSEGLCQAIQELILNQAEALNLSNKEIGRSGTAVLSRALEQNFSLTDLNLQNNNIGDSGITRLAKAIKRNSSLTQLNLECNNIRASGAKALSQALEHNTSLKTLSLSKNQIGDAGATGLARTLEHNSPLLTLNLSDNGIGDSAATALSRALAQNTSLKTLVLCESNISNPGGTGLARALEHNSSLTHLNLAHGYIDGSGIDAFAQALERNSSLTWLNLSDQNCKDPRVVVRFYNAHHFSLLESIERSLKRNKKQAEARERQALESSYSSETGGPSRKGKERVVG